MRTLVVGLIVAVTLAWATQTQATTSCLEVHPSGGCTPRACERVVCKMDSSCCDKANETMLVFNVSCRNIALAKCAELAAEQTGCCQHSSDEGSICLATTRKGCGKGEFVPGGQCGQDGRCHVSN